MTLRGKLQALVSSGDLRSFNYQEGILDETNREVDVLELVYPSGRKIKLTTFCSGCLESSGFLLLLDKPSED